jgi:hypothetical protein
MMTLVRGLRVCLPVALSALIATTGFVLSATTALAAETKAPARTRSERTRPAPVDVNAAVSASSLLPANASPYGRDTVWVNTANGMYHRDGDPGYGNTTRGRYMTEDEAIRAGYRLSKQADAE